MKRLLAVVMCVLLGLFMVGCGSNGGRRNPGVS